MRDCGAGCPAALLSSLPVEKLEPILDTQQSQQTHGRSSALAFSSATLALGSIIAAIWIQDTGSFDTVWMCFGLNGFLFCSRLATTSSSGSPRGSFPAKS